MKIRKFYKGYVVLISFLAVGAAVLVLSVSGILFGLNSSQSSLTVEESAKASFLADFCAEEALQQIRDSLSFSGSNTISQSFGICGYSVSNLGGSLKQVIASGTSGLAVRKLKINVSAVNPKLIINSWQAVADF